MHKNTGESHTNVEQAEIARAIAWINSDADETYEAFSVSPTGDGLQVNMRKPMRSFFGLPPASKEGLRHVLIAAGDASQSAFVQK